MIARKLWNKVKGVTIFFNHDDESFDRLKGKLIG
jgi:hypothetical protein